MIDLTYKKKNMKTFVYRFLLLFVAQLIGLVGVAQDKITYSGAPASQKVQFHDIFELSDGTFLMTGESRISDLSWIGVAPTILDTNGLRVISEKSSVTTSSFFTIFNTGFIIHLSEDRSTILHAVTFPDRFVQNIDKIRSANVPGEETGTLFISGKATAPIEGYFIARLDDNFVNGVPTTCDWLRFVPAEKVRNFSGCYEYEESHHRVEQVWDVDNQERITYVANSEYSHGSWVSIYRMEPDGTHGIVSHFPYHDLYFTYDNIPGDGKDSLVVEYVGNYPYPILDSTLTLELTYQIWDENASDWIDSVGLTTVSIDSGSSRIPLKHTGTGACKLMRSMVQSEYEWQTVDENGHLRITGKYPYDFLFAYPYYDTVNHPDNLRTMDGPGVLGHEPDEVAAGVKMNTDKVNDIVIDRRNNHMYMGFSQAIKNTNEVEAGYMSDYGPCSESAMASMMMTFESQLVALNEQGEMKWWSRLHKDVPLDSSNASKFLDKMVLDYKHDRLLVLARQYHTDTVNLWQGNQIAANPAAEGFKNKFTGSNNRIQQSWIGKYHLDTLLLDAATYVAEYAADASLTAQPLTDENLDNWNDPNQGNPDLGNTVCHDIKVDAEGNVIVACTGERVITTANAYQRMLYPDRDELKDSLAPETNAFVRQYSPDLSHVLYSSLVTGEWDRQTAEGGNNTRINSVFPLDSTIIAVGYDNGKGNQVSSYHPYDWGNYLSDGASGIYAELSLDPKLRIDSFMEIAIFETDVDLVFSVPSSISLDASNEFSVQLSTQDGSFRQTAVVGTLQSDQAGTIVVNIPSDTEPQDIYKFRVVSSNPVYYSNVVTLKNPPAFCVDDVTLAFVSDDTLACRGTNSVYEVNNICGLYKWELLPPTAGKIVGARDTNVVEIEWSDYTGSVSLSVQVTGIDSNEVVRTIFSDTLTLTLAGFESYIVADSASKRLVAYPNGDADLYEYRWKILSGFLPKPWSSDSTFLPVENDGGVTVTVRDIQTGCQASAADTINLFEEGNSIFRNEGGNVNALLYPNPSNGDMTVEFSGAAGMSPEIAVYRKDGVLIFRKNLNTVSDSYTEHIDLSGNTPGLYLVRIRMQDEYWTQRFLLVP